MDSLKALLAIVAIPMARVEQKLPSHLETKTLLDYAFRTLTLMMAAGVGYIFATLQAIEHKDAALENRLTRIEASRFTATEGRDVWIQLNQKVDKSDAPPKEYRDYVTFQLDDLRERLDRLEGR